MVSILDGQDRMSNFTGVQVTIDQLICASLSPHLFYWYEGGYSMLKGGGRRHLRVGCSLTIPCVLQPPCSSPRVRGKDIVNL